jgi:cobalamin biosynthesis Mg chelatase CobN
VSTPITPGDPGTPATAPTGAPSNLAPNGTAPATSNDPDAIRAEIEQTRADLAQTVDALHAKLDVKTRAKDKVAQLKNSATTNTGKPRPEVIAVTVAALVVVAGLVWWRRR